MIAVRLPERLLLLVLLSLSLILSLDNGILNLHNKCIYYEFDDRLHTLRSFGDLN